MNRRSPWTLELDRDDDGPLVARIAAAVRADIARGRLRPGQRLPGTRSLAATLETSRGTIVAAYEALAAEGWLRGDPARGTFVAELATDERPRRFAATAGPRSGVPTRPGFELGPPPRAEPPQELTARPYNLAGGLPDPRLVPATALARAYRRALGLSGARLLDYGDPRGHPALREALATMLAERRGLATSTDDVLVTRGSQMALWLIASTLCRPGDRVAVEALCYRAARDAFTAAGAALSPAPIDADGLVVEALAEPMARGELRAVYLTPHHHYPTTVTLAAARRLRLLELARRHRVAIIEDDYDNEFHYEGRPVLPLASVDRSGVVIYIGTLSKVVAPGLRIGYVVAPPPVLERMLIARGLIDRQGDLATEAAVAELMADGELRRHILRARRLYGERRDALCEALEQRLSGALTFSRPRGGMSLWAAVDPSIDLERWEQRALEQGVAVAPGRRFTADDTPIPFLRLGFARHEPGELALAVRRLARALRR